MNKKEIFSMQVLFARTYIGSPDHTINKVSVQLVLINGTFTEIIQDAKVGKGIVEVGNNDIFLVKFPMN